MNTQSAIKFEVRFWSKAHFTKEKIFQRDNMYQGTVICNKEQLHFHSPSQLLRILETMYKKYDKVK